jgi:hypothetical protein
MMRRVLAFEFYRAFASRLFFLALGIGCFVALAHIVNNVLPLLEWPWDMIVAKGGYPDSLFNTWMGGRGDYLHTAMYYLLLPLLVCLPHADSLFTDRSGGYAYQLASRVSLRRWYLAKATSVFCSGAAVAALPLLLNLAVTALFIPAIIPIPSVGYYAVDPSCMMSGLFYTHPLLYVLAFILMAGCFGGLFACMGVALGYLASNRFIVLLSPFIVCTFADLLLRAWGAYNGLARWSPEAFLRPDQPVDSSLAIVICEALMIAILLGVFTVVRAYRDETI